VAVAQYILEHKLGYRVDTVQVDEVPAWDALSQGRVDAILEDWGHPDQEKRYVTDKKTIQPGGDLGVTGHIGWFVPTYFVKEHPDVTDWHNLDKYADQFRTAESGGKGQLLDGSPSYVTNDKALVNNLGLDYDTANSAQLNAMTQAQMAAYKLLIIPGGNSITIGNNISSATTAHIKTAVRTYGLHYLGVCAGAFLVSYAGGTSYNDINLLNGIWFDLFTDSSCGTNEIKLCTETLSLADGSTIVVYWEDGPQLTTQGGTWGTVVAKYPNGQPAIIQGFAGNGWTLLQGIHPEAPRSWGCGTGCTCDFGTTTQAEDFAYSATLISAALNGTVLQHF